MGESIVDIELKTDPAFFKFLSKVTKERKLIVKALEEFKNLHEGRVKRVVERKRTFQWTDNLLRVYQMFPASIRSSSWPDIVQLANAGKVDEAKALAKQNEDRSSQIRAENVVARRIRIERTKLFSKLSIGQIAMKQVFANVAQSITDKVEARPSQLSELKRFNVAVHSGVMDLRRELNKLIRGMVWSAIVLGMRNMGEALKPIFRDNQESFGDDLIEMQLIEDRLSIGLTSDLVGRAKPDVKLTSEKWKTVMDKIYLLIVQTNNKGLKPSEVIWDLTRKAEADLKRNIANSISRGTSTDQIARDIKKYLSPGILDGSETGPGIYASPFKNAWRLARTETNRAYTKAQAEWSKGKPWIEGLRITLSSVHDEPDECDDYAGEIVSPNEYASLVPFHPHCMCYATTIIKPEFLAPGTEDE